MKTWLQKSSVEIGLFLLALAAGLGLRLILLGQPALGEQEAHLALQALGLSRGQDALVSTEPGYLLATTAFFSLLGASEWTARLWPALLGSGMLLTAWLLRERLGHSFALIATFLLAFEPVWVAASRTAAGAGAAVACLALALVFFIRGNSGWAGFFAGLSLLGGPFVWPAALSLAVVVWVFRQRLPLGQWRAAIDGRRFLLVGLGTFVLVGSLGFQYPAGLSAAAGSLVAYGQGWAGPPTTSILRMLLVWFAYQLPTLIFGLIGLVGGLKRKDPMAQALGAWWGIALLFVLVYPGRNPLDLVWPAIPMLILAAQQLDRLWHAEGAEALPVLGQAGVGVVLGVYIVYTMFFSPSVANQSIPQELLIRAGMAAALWVIITAMVAWGWSLRTAGLGLQWGALVLLAVFGVSAVFHAAGNARNAANELIRPTAYVASQDLLHKLLKETTMWRPDPQEPLTLAVVGLERSTLAWNLRDYAQASFSDYSASDTQPDVVITQQDAPPELAAEYRGQSLVWTETPAWSLLSSGEWLHWLAYRDVPEDAMEYQPIIYWVRSDQFPGGAALSAPAGDPGEAELNSP